MRLRHSAFLLAFSLYSLIGGFPAQAAEEPSPAAVEPANPEPATPAVAADSAENPDQPARPATGEPAPELKAAQENFDQTVEQWKAGLKELVLIQEEYRKAGTAEKADMEKEYQEKRDRLATELKPRLIQSAIQLYRLEGKENVDLQNFLRRVLLERFERDDWGGLYEMTHLLKDSGLDEPQLDLFDAIAAYGLNRFDEAQENIRKASEAGLLQPYQDLAVQEHEGSRKRRELGLVIRDTVAEYKELWKEEQALREAEAEADDLPRVKLKTTRGDIVVELFENEAPNTVANFISLVESGFYNGILFHRVLPGFMAQTGDPNGDGSGGPGYRIPCECYKDQIRNHFTGSLSMAKTAQRDTGGSQFFLTFRPTHHLNGAHTVFGRIIEGMDVLPELKRVDPDDKSNPEKDRILKATVLRKRDHAYRPQTLPGR